MPPSNMFLRGHEKPLAEINRDLLQATAPRASDHWLALLGLRAFVSASGFVKLEAHWMSLHMLTRFSPLDGLQLFFEDDRIMPTPRLSWTRLRREGFSCAAGSVQIGLLEPRNRKLSVETQPPTSVEAWFLFDSGG